MLKRLSASLAPSTGNSTSNNGPSISPSHSSASLASAYQTHYDNTSTYSHFPRPSGLSTPYSTTAPDLSPGLGYFGNAASGGPHSVHSAGGGLSPSLHNTSRNASPLQSPRLDSRPLPSSGPPALTPDWATSSPPLPIDRPTLQKSLRCLETLLVAMDEYRELNVRLGKVEKRLGKAAKELAASMWDGNSGSDKSGGAAKAREPYSILQALNVTSNLFDSLSDVSTKFSRQLTKEYDLINEIIGKQFKKIAKEERVQDDLIESLDMKLKKANYTYDKKIRSSMQGSNQAQSIHEQFVPILSSLTEEVGKSKTAHNTSMAFKREYLVKEMSRSLTCLSEIEFRKQCELVKKLGTLIGNVLAFQALLGPSNNAAAGGGTANNGKNAQGMEQPMPMRWPPELLDLDEMGRIHYTSNQSQESSNQYSSMQTRQGHVHPLASPHPSSSSEDLAADTLTQHQYQNAQSGTGRSLDDLIPPRAPFTTEASPSSFSNLSAPPSRSRVGSDASGSSTNGQQNGRMPSPVPPSTNRTYSNLSSASSSSAAVGGVIPRSSSLSQLEGIRDEPSSSNTQQHTDKYGSVSRNGGSTALNAPAAATTGMRSVSFPVEQMHASSVVMDHDATVTMRNVHTKPTVDTSFFPSSISTNETSTRNSNRDVRFEESSKRQDKYDVSPTWRENENARMTKLQPALSYSPSQSGKVGYFSDRSNRQLRDVSEEQDHPREVANNRDAEDVRRRGRNEEERDKDVRMPAAFVMEETSPEQYLHKRRDHHHHHQARPFHGEERSSSSTVASGSTADSTTSPSTSTTGTGANTSTTSYSRNLNDSYQQNNSTKESGGGAQLERSLSIESTASQQSFVARMKAKYAEEKQSRRNNHNTDSKYDETSANSASTGRRVSKIAQKWEEKTSSTAAAVGTGARPGLVHSHHHQHRASMPVLPSSHHWSPPPPSSGGRDTKPDIPRHGSATTAREVHLSICGCEDCAREGYGAGTKEHAGHGKGFAARRVSLPPGGP